MAIKRHKLLCESEVHMYRKGFTLIELLIVVAIIAILAAIAVPNFLEAQVRSKVSRVKADHRSIATAIEAYRVDTNRYVPSWNAPAPVGPAVNALPGGAQVQLFVRFRLVALTTPVAYISQCYGTPFNPRFYQHSDGQVTILDKNKSSEYNNLGRGVYNNPPMILAGANPDVTQWHLRDCGPDDNFNNTTFVGTGGSSATSNFNPYDPTNGTVSVGDIYRFGP